MEFNRIEVGYRIAKRRKELGYHKNHLSGIEHGKISPSMELFVAICKELDVTPNYLLEGAMHPENVSLDIVADLNKCEDGDKEILAKIVRIFVDKAEKHVTPKPK